MMDCVGKIVRSVDAAAANSYTLDLQGLAKGLYWVQAVQNGKTIPLQIQ